MMSTYCIKNMKVIPNKISKKVTVKKLQNHTTTTLLWMKLQKMDLLTWKVVCMLDDI